MSLFYHTRLRGALFKGTGCDTSLLYLKGGVSIISDSMILFTKEGA